MPKCCMLLASMVVAAQQGPHLSLVTPRNADVAPGMGGGVPPDSNLLYLFCIVGTAH